LAPIETGKGTPGGARPSRSEPITEDVLSDVHARIDGLKAQFERRGGAGTETAWKMVAAIALVAAGAALALALPARDAASKDDLKTVNDQVSALQQQVSRQEQDAQAQIDAAVKQVKAQTRQARPADTGSTSGQVQRNSAEIDRIEAYLRNPAGAFGPGGPKRR
jgi:hypothetical protein